jgi:hypothetical protein
MTEDKDEVSLTSDENRKVGLGWNLSDGVAQVNVEPLAVEGTACRCGGEGARVERRRA